MIQFITQRKKWEKKTYNTFSDTPQIFRKFNMQNGISSAALVQLKMRQVSSLQSKGTTSL